MKRHSCTFRLVTVFICNHQGAVKFFSNCPHSSAVDGTVNKWFIAAWRSVLITSALSPPTPHPPSTTTTRSSQAQLKLHLNIGMFKEVYNSDSPCPPQVTQFLFKVWLPPATSWLEIHFDCKISVYVDAVKCSLFCVCCWSPPPCICQMMSVHDERAVSQKIFQTLFDIACTAACQIGQCSITHTFLKHDVCTAW